MSGPAVSVCLAAHNGAPWIEEQISSILAQLGPDDEVVVVDDASTDDTAAVVRSVGDSRITLVRQQPNAGHVRTFERALGLARGRVIMLSDQDDVWPAGRRERLEAALADADLAVGNYRTFGDTERDPRAPVDPGMDGHGWRNIAGLTWGRRSYLGCCMAVRREFLDVVLPFPPWVEAHDHWLAIAGGAVGRVAHLAGEPVTLRRLHGTNLTRPGRPALDLAGTRARQAAHVVAALSRRVRRRGIGVRAPA